MVVSFAVFDFACGSSGCLLWLRVVVVSCGWSEKTDNPHLTGWEKTCPRNGAFLWFDAGLNRVNQETPEIEVSSSKKCAGLFLPTVVSPTFLFEVPRCVQTALPGFPCLRVVLE